MANCIPFILLLTWHQLRGFLQEPLWRHSGICLQTNGYIILFRETPPFPAKLQESPSLMGHALVSSKDFPLHRDSRGFFRISGWSASSSLYFTWYLLNAESIYGHFPNDVPCSLPKNWAPPPFLLLQLAQTSSYQLLCVTSEQCTMACHVTSDSEL